MVQEPRLPRRTPRGEQSAPGDHASVFTPIPWAFASFGRMAWSSRPSGAYRHTAWLVAVAGVAASRAGRVGAPRDIRRILNRAGVQDEPARARPRLAVDHAHLVSALPALEDGQEATVRGEVEASVPRIGRAEVATRAVHQGPRRDANGEVGDDQNLGSRGDQSARAIPAGPRRSCTSRNRPRRRNTARRARACIAARTWVGIAAPLKRWILSQQSDMDTTARDSASRTTRRWSTAVARRSRRGEYAGAGPCACTSRKNLTSGGGGGAGVSGGGEDAKARGEGRGVVERTTTRGRTRPGDDPRGATNKTARVAERTEGHGVRRGARRATRTAGVGARERAPTCASRARATRVERLCVRTGRARRGGACQSLMFSRGSDASPRTDIRVMLADRSWHSSDARRGRARALLRSALGLPLASLARGRSPPARPRAASSLPAGPPSTMPPYPIGTPGVPGARPSASRGAPGSSPR